MKTESKIVLASTGVGLVVWLIDAYLDYLIFYNDTFLDLLVLDMPDHEVYVRWVILMIFVVFGIIVSRLFAERRRVEQELVKAREELEKRVEERTAELSEYAALVTKEVAVRRQTERELRESEKKLNILSSHLMSAQEKERRRISLELHDDLGQSLTVLKLRLRAIERKLGNDLRPVKDDCDGALGLTDQIVESVRRLSHDLCPAILEDLGLSAALRCLVNDFSEHSETRISLDMEDIDHLFPEKAQILLYRIFQEALTNIEKHAQANNVSIVAEKNKSGVRFLIEDDGTGFDTRQTGNGNHNGRSLGLTAMDQRARMLGGSLAINSHEQEGTRIALTVPTKGESHESRVASLKAQASPILDFRF